MTDADIEWQMEEWRAAKESKDFATADRIRAELRELGHDPDKPRHGGGRGGRGQDSIEQKIERWRNAKKAKDFATADALRDELRSLGVEPDPSTRAGPAMQQQAFTPMPRMQSPAFMQVAATYPSMQASMQASQLPYDRAVERELDNWEEAKSSKDFATSDAIRQSLRGRGINPEEERRVRGDDGLVMQWQRAKAAGDYPRSDKIRQQLRDNGADPERMAPAGGGFPSRASPFPVPNFPQHASPVRAMAAMMTAAFAERAGPVPNDRATKQELSQWFDARDRKDWAVADSIRDRLRKKGIEPQQCERPLSGHHTPKVLGGATTEILRQWFEARDVKDFATADALRDELRGKGIEPQQCERPHDPETTAKLSSWFQARDQKDWASADVIRDELRTKGIEPSKCQRPSDGESDENYEEQLTQWFEARDNKDFVTADAIRDDLRAKGIEPQNCERPGGAPGGGRGGGGRMPAPAAGGGVYGKAPTRPRAVANAASPYGAASGGDMNMESQLDLWWTYKQNKNFGAADKIRAELRAMGIEPSDHRPTIS